MVINVSMLLLLFLTFSVLVANPKKLLYTVANPARGLLNREKRTKEKVWQHTPPPHLQYNGRLLPDIIPLTLCDSIGEPF